MQFFQKALAELTPNHVIGLDIGAGSICMVQLDCSEPVPTLMRYSLVPLKPNSMLDGEVLNLEHVVASILVCVSSRGFQRSSNCILGLSGSGTFIVRVSVPQMRKEELDESIDFDIEQYLPFSILEAETDCLVSNFEAGHGQMDVLATAVKKALLASHTDIALKAGLRPVGANVGVLGAVKAYVQNHNPAQDKTSVILDIGANTTSLCWLNGHEVRFTRELKIGGNFANQEVVKAINCSLHQAEVYRKNPEAFDADMPEVVRTANNQFVETLATEVREALEFLKSCEIKANISDIYLCGGASQTEGLTEALSNRLGIVPCNLEPFRTLDIKTHGFDRAILDADGPFFAKAVGLALSGLKQ